MDLHIGYTIIAAFANWPELYVNGCWLKNSCGFPRRGWYNLGKIIAQFIKKEGNLNQSQLTLLQLYGCYLFCAGLGVFASADASALLNFYNLVRPDNSLKLSYSSECFIFVNPNDSTWRFWGPALNGYSSSSRLLKFSGRGRSYPTMSLADMFPGLFELKVSQYRHTVITRSQSDHGQRSHQICCKVAVSPFSVSYLLLSITGLITLLFARVWPSTRPLTTRVNNK